RSALLRALPAFPTRRSSDLLVLGGARQRRRALLASFVLVDVGVLGIFKYLDFGVRSIAAASNTLFGTLLDPPLLQLVLPLGISLDRKSTRLNSSHVSISYAV